MPETGFSFLEEESDKITPNMTASPLISNRLYHLVPDRMIGEVLYPLNRLALVDAVVASAARRKYETRERLMAVRLPILNCLWNDVLHFSPIHPAKIKHALIDSGYQHDLPARSFFAIDPKMLLPGKAVHFRNSTDTAGKYDFQENDFSVFDHAVYRELEDVPEQQHSYFIRTKEEGGRPLLWARTPHVFYHGEVDIKRAEVVRW